MRKKGSISVQLRHTQIIEILKADRYANVKLLAKKLYVSEATIRRDLKQMQALGLIERSHGGAILPNNAKDISLSLRLVENAKAKQLIANKALPLIPPFNSLFVDSSSTALALAERMDLSFKTVVTNNLQTAIQLCKKENLHLILVGGSIHSSSLSTTGSWTARQIEEFNFDLCILSCSAINNEEVYERTLEQKEIKLAAIKRSKKAILLVDKTKFCANGIYKLANLCDFDNVVTDDI